MRSVKFAERKLSKEPHGLDFEAVAEEFVPLMKPKTRAGINGGITAIAAVLLAQALGGHRGRDHHHAWARTGTRMVSSLHDYDT
jgi:hypothetical protein